MAYIDWEVPSLMVCLSRYLHIYASVVIKLRGWKKEAEREVSGRVWMKHQKASSSAKRSRLSRFPRVPREVFCPTCAHIYLRQAWG